MDILYLFDIMGSMRAIEKIREHIKTVEFDYGLLMDVLKDYSKPRDAVSRLLQDQSIIRVKKGYYVFGKRYQTKPICLETTANLIYGPSYISLESALSYYGLIPERVTIITSMTPLRSKRFVTPIGIFEYEHLHPSKVSIGVTLKEVDAQHKIIIATPEKALADRIAPYKNIKTAKDVRIYVCEGLRIEEEALVQFRLPLLEKINEVYKNPAVSGLLNLIKEIAC